MLTKLRSEETRQPHSLLSEIDRRVSSDVLRISTQKTAECSYVCNTEVRSSYSVCVCVCVCVCARARAAFGRGCFEARTDTTQQSGQTPDKEVGIKNITVYVSGYTETDTTGMLSPQTDWRFGVAVDMFLISTSLSVVLCRYWLQCSLCLNPLNPELNPICYLLALLGAHHFLHVSSIRVKLLTFRLLMSYIYIYMEQPFLIFLDHTQRRSTVGRTPLDE